MLAEEHIQTARDFLKAADRKFAGGDRLKGSKKMWRATSHAVMAVAQQRGWSFSSHKAMREAIRRLAGERGDPYLEIGFSAAEKFHANFHHDFMEEDELEFSHPPMRDFVLRVLALNGSGQDQAAGAG